MDQLRPCRVKGCTRAGVHRFDGHPQAGVAWYCPEDFAGLVEVIVENMTDIQITDLDGLDAGLEARWKALSRDDLKRQILRAGHLEFFGEEVV